MRRLPSTVNCSPRSHDTERPSVKRAYGDWTTPHRGVGSTFCRARYPADPPVQLHDRQKRNGLVVNHRRDGSAVRWRSRWILSGVVDSDFTRLATRLRQSGMVVYGFGESKTPERFVAACDKFVLTEILRPKSVANAGTNSVIVPPLEDILRPAIEATAKDNGWSPLSTVGSMILKSNPSFDSRNYGLEKLGQLVREQTFLEIKEVPTSDSSGNMHLHVRTEACDAALIALAPYSASALCIQSYLPPARAASRPMEAGALSSLSSRVTRDRAPGRANHRLAPPPAHPTAPPHSAHKPP